MNGSMKAGWLLKCQLWARRHIRGSCRTTLHGELQFSTFREVLDQTERETSLSVLWSKPKDNYFNSCRVSCLTYMYNHKQMNCT
jgi:hypothetical protein